MGCWLFGSPLLRYMYVYVFVSHIVPLFISYVHITAAPYTCTQTDTHTHGTVCEYEYEYAYINTVFKYSTNI